MASSRASSSATSGRVYRGIPGTHRAIREAAHGGPSFSTRSATLSPATQIRLLRVLETKCVEPVGSHRARKVDVTLLAATNRPLGDEVGAGRFRNDLYYRLNVPTSELPPLRERREDIPLLARYFLDESGSRCSEGQREIGPRPWRSSCTMTGRETCASYGTPLNTRSSMRKPICSGLRSATAPERLCDGKAFSRAPGRRSPAHDAGRSAKEI